MKRSYKNFLDELIDKVAEMEATTTLLVKQYNFLLKNLIPGEESEKILKNFHRHMRYSQTCTTRSKELLVQIVREEKDFRS